MIKGAAKEFCRITTNFGLPRQSSGKEDCTKRRAQQISRRLAVDILTVNRCLPWSLCHGNLDRNYAWQRVSRSERAVQLVPEVACEFFGRAVDDGQERYVRDGKDEFILFVQDP